MASIENPSRHPVPLPTGHVVPRLGVLTTTNDVLRCPDNAAFLRGQHLSGALVVTFDPDPDPEEDPPLPVPAAAPVTAPKAPAPLATEAPDALPKKKD